MGRRPRVSRNTEHPYRFPKTHATRFILWNIEGEPLDGCYIYIIAAPMLSVCGRLSYVDDEGTTDPISFRIKKDGTYAAWCTYSKCQRFCITPNVVDGELVGLRIKFPNDSTAYFGKEPMRFDTEITECVLESNKNHSKEEF